MSLTPLLLRFCFAALTAALLSLAPVQGAQAQALPQGQDLQTFCPADGTVFNRIIQCLEDAIVDAGDSFITTFYTEMETTVYVFLILSLSIFGVMLASGAIERIARDTVQYILKMGFVLYIIKEGVYVYETFVSILMGTITAVGTASAFGGTSLRCPYKEVTGDTPTTQPMWERADCIIDLMIGLSSNASINGAGTQEGLARGTMAFFYYNLQSGALGILIGLVGLYICFNLVMALLRASYAYIVALMVLTLLFVMGVMLAPLIMFRVTFEFFDRWLKMIFSMILQPLLLFAYLNLMLSAFDLLLFSGSNSLMYTIAGSAADSKSFNLHQYAEDNGLYSANYQAFTHDVDQSRLQTSSPGANAGTLGNVAYSSEDPNYGDLAQIPIDLPYRTVDYDKINGGAAALAAATLLVGLASYVLLTFMREVPLLAQDLSGSFNRTPNIIPGDHSGGLNLPLVNETQALARQTGDGLRSQLGNLVGARRGG